MQNAMGFVAVWSTSRTRYLSVKTMPPHGCRKCVGWRMVPVMVLILLLLCYMFNRWIKHSKRFLGNFIIKVLCETTRDDKVPSKEALKWNRMLAGYVSIFLAAKIKSSLYSVIKKCSSQQLVVMKEWISFERIYIWIWM